MLVERLQEYLNHLPADRPSNTLTLSKMGQCVRRTHYDLLGHTPTALDWKAQLVFSDGRVGHEQIRGLLKDAGIKLHSEEKEVTFNYGKLAIKGHIDGLIDLDGETYLFEFKTMGDYPFERFTKGEPLDRTYAVQVQAYMATTGVKNCLYLAKNKNTADVHERIIPFDPKELTEVAERLVDVTTKLPEREYGFDKYGKLDWHCGYCPHRATCWAGVPMKEVKRNTYVKPKEV